MLLAGECMKLREYLFFNRISVTEFSKKVGCSRNHISGIINGRYVPGKFLASAIEHSTNGEVTAEELLKEKDS